MTPDVNHRDFLSHQLFRPDRWATTTDPSGGGPEIAMMQMNTQANGPTSSDVPPLGIAMPASYQKFTSQMDLGKYLTAQYHIRRPQELSSCETCHR